MPTTEKVHKDAQRNIVQLSNITDQEGINTEWLLVWQQVELWYGDVMKKETARQLLIRLQREYELSLR